MSYRKATADEIRAYAAELPRKVYPLVGFVTVGKVQCAVEGLFEGHDNPNYEVMAPNGLHFDDGEILHSLLCTTIRDVNDRVRGRKLKPCDGCNGWRQIEVAAEDVSSGDVTRESIGELLMRHRTAVYALTNSMLKHRAALDDALTLLPRGGDMRKALDAVLRRADNVDKLDRLIATSKPRRISISAARKA